MCGEHEVVKPDVRKTLGSSPHVRGTPIHGQRGYRGVGIIPACAGNTALWTGRCLAARDHPRMCGEHISSMSGKAVGAGSSPHVRGTPGGGGSPTGGWFGIIPACAGNTLGSRHMVFYAWDHPRMCGEHVRKVVRRHRPAGSSPHVRGTLVPYGWRREPVGIIPACAGNTFVRRIVRWVWSDHPRMCGEHRIVRRD